MSFLGWQYSTHCHVSGWEEVNTVKGSRCLKFLIWTPPRLCLCICVSSFGYINLCLPPIINVTMSMRAFREFCLSSEFSCVSRGTALVSIKTSLMWQLLLEQKKVCYEKSNVVIVSLDNADISECRELCNPNNLWSAFITFIHVILLWDHESISVDWKYLYQFNSKGWVNKQMNLIFSTVWIWLWLVRKKTAQKNGCIWVKIFNSKNQRPTGEKWIDWCLRTFFYFCLKIAVKVKLLF